MRIISQGHWHIEYMRIIARRPGLLVIGVGTEEKRPSVTSHNFSGRTQLFSISSREGSTHFRDGEDGSEPTIFEIAFPRTLPRRIWECSADDWDRYESRIVAYTRNKD